MKSTKKVVVLALCMAAIAAASVFGTMAYLTDNESVTNTFTVGKVEIKLDEENIDGMGANGETNVDVKRDTANKYHLLPGETHTKDPTVTVLKGSEDSYVRMMVEVVAINELMEALPNSGATEKYYGEDDVFLLQMLCTDEDGSMTWSADEWEYKGYTKTSENGESTGIYEFRYKEVVNTGEEGDTKLPALFTHITLPGEVDNEGMKGLENVEINVTAHAIQATGFESADAAWDAFSK